MKKLIISSILTITLALTATATSTVTGACEQPANISSISEAQTLLMSKAGFRGYPVVICPKCGGTARVYKNSRTNKTTIDCEDCSYRETF